MNFSFNPMTRLPYVEPAHIPDGQLSKGLVMRIDKKISSYRRAVLNKEGGTFSQRNTGNENLVDGAD